MLQYIYCSERYIFAVYLILYTTIVNAHLVGLTLHEILILFG